MDANEAIDDPRATPDLILAAIRSGPPLDPEAEERHLDRLVERFPPEQLREAIRPRLDDLGGADGGIILRLIEAHLALTLADPLAEALLRQPDLAPDRAYEALALLDMIEHFGRYPGLRERWEELSDLAESGDATGDLAAQLEAEPEGSWVALEGLGAIDAATRSEIIASLAEAPSGPGLVAFLRLLTYAHDDATRAAALEALFEPRRDDEAHRRAWAELAADHFDPRVRDRAARRLAIGGRTDAEIAATVASVAVSPGYPQPELAGSLVTRVDGSGRGTILLASRDRAQWVVAALTCDVWAGIVAVEGQLGPDPSFVGDFFAQFAADKSRDDLVEDDPDLAIALLSGSWLLSGPSTNPALRFWIERTVGPAFQPVPFAGAFDAEDVATESLAHLAGPCWAILEACPDWVDRSPLTFDLAEAIILRSGEAVPDPRRDAGAFRYLFEHRLAARMEHYRRLLLWMASFWKATDDTMSRSALALAWQLADPQNAVPGHPFVVALATQSLAAAQTALRAGLDPRRSGMT